LAQTAHASRGGGGGGGAAAALSNFDVGLLSNGNDDGWVVLQPGLHPVFALSTLRGVRAVVVHVTRREAVIGLLPLGSPSSSSPADAGSGNTHHAVHANVHKVRVEAGYSPSQPLGHSLPRLARALDSQGPSRPRDPSSNSDRTGGSFAQKKRREVGEMVLLPSDDSFWSRLKPSVQRAGLETDSLAADVIRSSDVWERASDIPRDALQRELNQELNSVGLECTDLRITTPAAYVHRSSSSSQGKHVCAYWHLALALSWQHAGISFEAALGLTWQRRGGHSAHGVKLLHPLPPAAATASLPSALSHFAQAQPHCSLPLSSGQDTTSCASVSLPHIVPTSPIRFSDSGTTSHIYPLSSL
jgi:hypothetical protein